MWTGQMKAYFKILSIKKLDKLCFTQIIFKVSSKSKFTTEDIKNVKNPRFFPKFSNYIFFP